jgi:hypothetical protein
MAGESAFFGDSSPQTADRETSAKTRERVNGFTGMLIRAPLKLIADCRLQIGRQLFQSAICNPEVRGYPARSFSATRNVRTLGQRINRTSFAPKP